MFKNLFRKIILPVMALSVLLPASWGTTFPAAAAEPATAGRDVFTVPAEPAPKAVSGPDQGKYQLVIDSRTITGSLLDRRGLIDLNIEFASGSARLEKSAMKQITEIAEALKDPKLANRKILITGHTDAVGSAAANLELSRRRARSVKNALVEMGITPARLAARGLGESQPLADNRTAAGRARNRRVTLSLEKSPRKAPEK